MTQDFIFAQDVIIDPDTSKIFAIIRNGGVWRDGAKIAVLVGKHMYDLNGKLLGKLAGGDGPLPSSFKNDDLARHRDGQISPRPRLDPLRTALAKFDAKATLATEKPLPEDAASRGKRPRLGHKERRPHAGWPTWA
jgi:hypothetical protein